MKKPPEPCVSILTVAELAERLGCPFEGNGKTALRGVASLERAGSGDLVFMAQPKHRKLLERTKGAAAILRPEERFDRLPVIRSANPPLSFIRAVEFFFQPYRPEPGLHPQALVSPSARIGKDVSIGPFTIVGDEVEVGAGTILFPLVCIYPGVKIGRDAVIHSHVSIRENCRLGNRVILHSGVVIGADGYGYIRTKDGSHTKIPQKGSVIIEDDVEIGANSTVDRAALDVTVIRRGTKIDNLVQVAHSVEVGENTILAAQTGIAGSSKVGKNVVIAGQVGIIDHVSIGDNVTIAAKTGVSKDVPAGSFVAGIPHRSIQDWRKERAAIPRLYDLLKEFKTLKKRVEELEGKKK